jgi:hypothetical protein
VPSWISVNSSWKAPSVCPDTPFLSGLASSTILDVGTPRGRSSRWGCLPSGHRHHISQDIGITRPARSGDVQGTPDHHRRPRRGPLPARGRPRLRRQPKLGQSPGRPLPRRGEAAFQPRSRRPKTSPTAIPPATVTLITSLRGKLTTAGLDAGPDTIAWHLAHHHGTRVWVATIRPLPDPARAGHPQPAKRPKASSQRFQAALPNECWQADSRPRPAHPAPTTHPPVTPRSSTWPGDHRRDALDVTAHQGRDRPDRARPLPGAQWPASALRPRR